MKNGGENIAEFPNSVSELGQAFALFQVSKRSLSLDLYYEFYWGIYLSAPESHKIQDDISLWWQPPENAVFGYDGYYEKMDRSQTGLGSDSFSGGDFLWRKAVWIISSDKTDGAGQASPAWHVWKLHYNIKQR